MVLFVQTEVGPVMAATVGGGFTLIVAKVGAALHPFALPLSVKMDVCKTVVVLVRFPTMEERNPLADGSIPIKLVPGGALVLFHVAEVSAGVLVHAMVKSSPEQTVCGLSDVKVMTGVWLTVTEDVVLLQPVVEFVKVKVTEPADTPVMTPALVTVATDELLLVHVPPKVGDNVAVLPVQTEAGAETIGFAFMVTEEVVLLQPVVPSVNVNVTVPGDTGVTTPALVTVATALLLLAHVPPEFGDKVAVLPIQIDDGAVNTGLAFTVTVTGNLALSHPVVLSV